MLIILFFVNFLKCLDPHQYSYSVLLARCVGMILTVRF